MIKTKDMFKKANVILLPTNDLISRGVSKPTNNHLSFVESNIKNEYVGNPQHLYIISPEEEIKEGDWYLVELFAITGDTLGLHLEQCISITTDFIDDIWVNKFSIELTRHITNCKKIIASTNTSLILKFNDSSGFYSCPEPSPSFIQKYIEEYNKGNVITEVIVEYEDIICDSKYSQTGKFLGYKNKKVIPYLKVNPKDNTITIKEIKDNYSREEVILFAKTLKGTAIDRFDKDGIDNWINLNL